MDRINIMIYDLLGISISQSTSVLPPPSARFDEGLDLPDDDDDVIIDSGCFVFFKMNVCSRLFYTVNPMKRFPI